MKCADCRYWSRYKTPGWEQERADRGEAKAIKDIAESIQWGDCDRRHSPLSLIDTDYSEVETHETFGCVQFEAKEQT